MNLDDLSSQLLNQLSKEQTPNFEYGNLEAQTRLLVQQCTNEIKALMRRNCQDIIDIGQKLIEVKQYLGHGNFRNWLKFEFNWSVSAATKFMQVAEQFKCVNFTHLNITASSLYLIAAPSTPKKARIEVLERASNGENISYNKAKAIVSQYRITASLEPNESGNVMEPTHNETPVAFYAQKDLTQKDVLTQTQALSSEESKLDVVFEDCQIATTMQDIPDDTTETPTSMDNQVAIFQQISNATINEMAISMKNLTAQQLARVIIEAANNGLSEEHLLAVITASQQILNTRQQSLD